ncbi:hypothetical protein [Burkholderia stagnalis]|uniref:hypothetical protein n=1 Tax=Burkholderia stagnalis TaxID=1503054 RepID=UPI000F5BC156|nr:hypothetical protein [Burkholderia stagnalis]RQP94949.1 hypothetical protein DF164_34625 [Burkholderia stagnalis]RQY31841.1 hypothetical protein DF113_32600 [Burkholderia stagnalis]RQY71527.1 hypothetical protein DF110_10415 [Burkholderia stagnalis]
MFMVITRFGAILVVSCQRLKDVGILMAASTAAMVAMFVPMVAIETHFAALAFLADLWLNCLIIKRVWFSVLGHAPTPGLSGAMQAVGPTAGSLISRFAGPTGWRTRSERGPAPIAPPRTTR